MEVCDDQGEELNVKRKKPNFFIKKKEVEVEVEVMFLYFSLAIFVFLLLFLAPLSLLHRIHSMRRSGGSALSLLLAPSTRRAWQQQQGWRESLESILPFSSSISSPPSPFSTSTSSSSSSSKPSTPFHLLDRVFVTRMPFFARHGVHAAEAQLGQRFEVDAEVFVDGLGKSVLAEGEESSSSSSSSSVPADSGSRTFDYSRIHAVAQAVIRDGPRAQLVETLAARIADALLEEEGKASSRREAVRRNGH